MSLNSLLKSVLPELPAVSIEREIETLQMLPAETLFLSLKEADSETALWVMENARASQVQGVLDLDCWQGDAFLPERFFRYFEFITYTTPERLLEYMKDLDPEIIVLSLMDAIEVLDFDPQNPPEVSESQLLISPGSQYALIFKKEDPELKERVFQWLNKLSAMDFDLMRRHLESLKWEQKNDLEEFAYQIKKGRVEELGFVEREEALKFFSQIRAPELKTNMLNEPLKKHVKEETPLVEILGSEDFLPQPISKAVKDDGFFRKALEKVENTQLKDILRMEFVRTINGVFSAEDILSQDLSFLRESASRTRSYLDLGLLYLSGGNVDQAAEHLCTQPVFEIARLGWCLLQDLTRASKEIRSEYNTAIFENVDRQLLKDLEGRHPEIKHPDVIRDLELKNPSLISIENIHRIADHVGALSVCAHFIRETLSASLKLNDEAIEANESAWTRLATGIFRQSCSREFSVALLSKNEWNEINKSWNKESFDKISNLISEKVPSVGKTLFVKRLMEKKKEIQKLIESNTTPNPQFSRALRWEI